MLNNITITDITRTKKGFNALFSGDRFLFSVDDVVLYRNNINIGSCFSQQELSCIEKQSTAAKAVDKCYTLLSTRMHSRKELYDKLCRFYDSETARSAVRKMEELELVDDFRFATLKAEYMLNVKKQPFSAIRRKLSSLGVDKDIIDNVILSFDSDGAGKKAANRTIKALENSNIGIRVLSMSPYKDPDEFIKNLGKDEYAERIKRSLLKTDYQLKTMSEKYDLTIAEEKEEYLRCAVDFIIKQQDRKKMIQEKNERQR